MNNKLYLARMKQEKIKLTLKEKQEDNNFIGAIALCILVSILFFRKCNLELKKQSYANTNIQPVLQK